MGEELLDWEVVHGSDTESTDSTVIDDGLILSHHFSVDNLAAATTDQILDSGDSSRVDLGIDQLDVYESGDASVGNELGLSDGDVRVSDFEAADEKLAESEAVADDESHTEDATECVSETNHVQVESQSGVEEPIDDEIGLDSEAVEESGENTVVSKNKETVWWKMPLVLVKYCSFRIGPVWSVSMAAALMGFLLLGRRLYNLKKKPQGIHLKVAIDYKKVSQVMNKAARLNEAFTEVRRVPVIRPALPAPGAWPVLSLR